MRHDHPLGIDAFVSQACINIMPKTGGNGRPVERPLKPLPALRQDTDVHSGYFNNSDVLVKGRRVRSTRKSRPKHNHNHRIGELFESLFCSVVCYFRITIRRFSL